MPCRELKFDPLVVQSAAWSLYIQGAPGRPKGIFVNILRFTLVDTVHLVLVLVLVLLLLALQPTVGFGLFEQCPSIFSYLPPTLSIFSLPALEDTQCS